MTPKDKADYLIDLFTITGEVIRKEYTDDNFSIFDSSIELIKQRVILLVNELINSTQYSSHGFNGVESTEYWLEVKEEILKIK